MAVTNGRRAGKVVLRGWLGGCSAVGADGSHCRASCFLIIHVQLFDLLILDSIC